MVQGDSYTYRDFYLERRVKPRKKEELQKKDILKAIDKLYSQRDYWSLEAIRLLTAQLAEEAPQEDSLEGILAQYSQLYTDSKSGKYSPAQVKAQLSILGAKAVAIREQEQDSFLGL